MRQILTLACVAAILASSGQNEEDADILEGAPNPNEVCQFSELAECLSQALDGWAIALFHSRDNILAIPYQECLSSREHIRRCIEEQTPTFGCDQENVLAVAETMTDLIFQKKASGSFLISYYLTAYVCTDDGRALVDDIGRKCLKDQHFSEMLSEAVGYMNEILRYWKWHIDTSELCSLLIQRSILMRDIGEVPCPEHVHWKLGILMCESVKTAFLIMYPDQFGDSCKFSCRAADYTDLHKEPSLGNGAASQHAGRI